jgi:hypothetical protein
MTKLILRTLVVGVLAGLVCFAYSAIRARSNLVTLKVRNVDVREIIKRIERQTWESIFVQKEIQGNVTLNVRNMPLEEVLTIIGEQTSSRWTAIYPLYSSSKSLDALKQSLRGEIVAAENGWTNLQARPIFLFGGMFGNNVRSQNKLVSLQFQERDLSAATTALSRFSQAQVVSEDGTVGTVQLNLTLAPWREAVAQVARQVHRNWVQCYNLQTWRGRDLAMARTQVPSSDGSTNSPGEGSSNRSWWQMTPETHQLLQKQFEAQLEAMSPEERERAQKMRQQMEEIRQLPRDQQRQRWAEFTANPEIVQRMQNKMFSGIKNTTPEQRVERYQRMTEWRRHRDQP